MVPISNIFVIRNVCLAHTPFINLLGLLTMCLAQYMCAIVFLLLAQPAVSHSVCRLTFKSFFCQQFHFYALEIKCFYGYRCTFQCKAEPDHHIQI